MSRAVRRIAAATAVAACPLLLVGAWYAAARAGWPSPRAVPLPGDVGELAASELARGGLWRDVLATLVRAGVGVAIATALGTVLGVALGRSRRVWRTVEPTVDFVRAIPPLLVFPLLLLGAGYGERARVLAVVFGTAGTIVIHVAAALSRVPRERVDMISLAGIRGVTAFRTLYLWEALPSLLTGVRIALAQGLIVATATEMLVGARAGLGARALQAQLTYRADLLWLIILLAGTAGFALSGVVAAIERRVAARVGIDDHQLDRSTAMPPSRR